MHRRRLVTPQVLAMAMLLMCLTTWGIFASDPASPSGDTTPPASKSAAKPDPTASDQITLLKQQMALQQKQIEQMQKTLEEQKNLLQQLTSTTAATTAAAPPVSTAKTAAATAKVAAPTGETAQAAKPADKTQEASEPHAASLGQVASNSPIIPAAQKKSDNAIVPVGAPSAAINTPAQETPPETSPLQFHIGSATFTPVGFMDFTSVFRNKAAGGNIGTSFGSIPYGTSYQTNLSEERLSIQNSRIGFRTDADVHGAHVIGYMEADFLGTPASLNVAVTNDAQLLRARLYWVDLRKGGWEILGGQTWSLLTPGRVGISPLPADVFYTQDMDVNYQSGLFWGRIPELRFVYHLPSDKAAFAIAIDSPDQYAGGSSGGGTVVFPTAISSTYASELDQGASSGGIATPNVAPDIIAKIALDPSKRAHFEIGGVARFFKVWYPGTSSIPAQNFTTEGVGGFLNLHVEVVKGLRLMTNNFWNDGGGRYIFGEAPDLVANANGSITALHSASTVTGLEANLRNTLFYAYYGGTWIGRDPVIDTNGKYVGYGYPGSSTGNNRTIQEITFGTNSTIWKHPRYGALNFITQYSYLVRDPWYTTVGSPVNANDNLVFFDLRYTLPGSAPTLGRPAR